MEETETQSKIPIFLCSNDSFNIDVEIAKEEVKDAKETIQNPCLV